MNRAGRVVGVSFSAAHAFSKTPQPRVRLLAGLGVLGDAHAGATVRHRSRRRADPTQPNLRQVHLIHAELLDALNTAGFGVAAGALGENVLTRGLYLLALPTGTKLYLGDAVIEVTGLRNPCAQLEDFQQGLLGAVLDRDADGTLFRKAGIMGVVLRGGEVGPGDEIGLEEPPEPHRPLARV